MLKRPETPNEFKNITDYTSNYILEMYSAIYIYIYIYHQVMPITLSLSLSLSPYRPLLMVGPLDFIQFPHRADARKFLWVGPHLRVCVLESITLENVVYEFVITSPAVHYKSCWSYLNGIVCVSVLL